MKAEDGSASVLKGRVGVRSGGEYPGTRICRQQTEKGKAQRRTGVTAQAGAQGQDLKGKKVALRYRLQIAAITWMEAGYMACEE